MSDIFSRVLDTNGDGSGTKNAIGDYSDVGLGETVFFLQPPPRLKFHVMRLILLLRDSAINADDYGAIAGGLTNGITVKFVNDNAVLNDLTDGVPVMDSAGWARICYDATAFEWGAGNEFLGVRWTFAKAGRTLLLRGNQRNGVAPDGERLEVTLHDDLTGLVEHYFTAQGYTD